MEPMPWSGMKQGARRASWAPGSALAAAMAAGLLVLGGCGGSDSEDEGPQSKPAPAASEFPAPDGRKLNELLQATAEPVDLVVSPAQQVLRLGKNRFAFGIFNVDRSQVTDAEVALYAAPGGNAQGRASGPYPARIETLETEQAFRSRTTADDPGAALAAYVTEIDFKKPGPWSLAAMVREGDSYKAVLLPSVSQVGQFDAVPAVGEKAPRTETETAETTEPDLLETRTPPDTMHEANFADVLGRKPVVLLFSSPSFCVSRTCGPVTDVAEQVKQEAGEGVEFIHQEPYVDNQVQKGLRPPLRAFNLPGEPWVFVIDRDGVIRAEFEGPFSVAELTEAVEQVSGGAQ